MAVRQVFRFDAARAASAPNPFVKTGGSLEHWDRAEAFRSTVAAIPLPLLRWPRIHVGWRPEFVIPKGPIPPAPLFTHQMKISADETQIRGGWKVVGGRVTADENSRRIETLVNEYLRELGRDQTGWDVLYVDPSDGRFWEFTHPQSHLHGGGPALLTCLTDTQAREKYARIFVEPHS